MHFLICSRQRASSILYAQYLWHALSFTLFSTMLSHVCFWLGLSSAHDWPCVQCPAVFNFSNRSVRYVQAAHFSRAANLIAESRLLFPRHLYQIQHRLCACISSTLIPAAGMCRIGVSMVPDNTYAETQYKPIGLIGYWSDGLLPRSTERFYSATSGPFTSTCCAKYVFWIPLCGLCDVVGAQKVR